MASKSKKIIALILAAVVVVAAIPVALILTNPNAGAGQGEVNKGYELPPKPTNTKDAAVVDAETVVTMEDYKVIAESDTYKMHFYEPRL